MSDYYSPWPIAAFDLLAKLQAWGACSGDPMAWYVDAIATIAGCAKRGMRLETADAVFCEARGTPPRPRRFFDA